jgi:hypothetical protein
MEFNDLTWELNEARWDRALRVLLGIMMLALVFVGPKTAWGYLGVLPLTSGVLGHCVVYKLLGVSTSKPGKPRRNALPSSS